MGEYVVWDRPQMTIWGMRIACWIPKPANARSQFVTLNVLPLQKWLHGHTSVLRSTYIACLVTVIKGAEISSNFSDNSVIVPVRVTDV